MGLRQPDSQSVREPTGRFVPHNRIRGAEADRGQSGGTFVGEHDHGSSQRHAVACTGGYPSGCRFSVTRDVARYSLELISWCRVYDLSVTLCLQIQPSQASMSLIFNFRFRRTLRVSSHGSGVRKRGLPGDLCVPTGHGVPGTSLPHGVLDQT